ncbi:TIGR01244 family sulfur transferase [Inhella gelatinilytica]|uniref:TIGR01244 family phosphatase n=1 Tax=Inhella gelatinilytica TaxID=2795030 RepID=A0A931IXN7_9BURK|nr:TIGR01244 family sulfur transferase [Inhella gelatinilytica]MBH9552915.1 TIGR01244 family phosphatase [Inhella gelatinilytica]
MHSITIRPIAEHVCAAPQLGPEHMAELARLGFRSVINNRPDYEHGPDQPENAAIEAAALAAGLEYRFLPVSGGFQTPAQIQACAELLRTLPPPILLFCRSGSRSTQLFLQARELG